MQLAHVSARAACEDKLDIIDDAFERPGGPAAHYLAEEICPSCPIWVECLEFAMAHGEHGPWGGTTERERHLVHHKSYWANIADRAKVRHTWRDGLGYR